MDRAGQRRVRDSAPIWEPAHDVLEAESKFSNRIEWLNSVPMSRENFRGYRG